MGKTIVAIRVDPGPDGRTVRYLARNHTGIRYILKVALLNDSADSREDRQRKLTAELVGSLPARV